MKTKTEIKLEDLDLTPEEAQAFLDGARVITANPEDPIDTEVPAEQITG
jgi:hypothetical protein